jgi:hypothetical protein
VLSGKPGNLLERNPGRCICSVGDRGLPSASVLIKRGSVGHVGAPGGNWGDLRGAVLRIRLQIRIRVDLEISEEPADSLGVHFGGPL